MSQIFPPITPFFTGKLAVSGGHEIYYELSGTQTGKPVIVCHGGPGGGCTPSMRRYFDPAQYKIILFDQRGCGRSTPHACVENNTTWDLIADMELLRRQLGVERWQVFGGSWGSTLSLAYAQSHPERVSELVLRGIFLLRAAELRWFYQEGANWVYPDAWRDFIAPIPAAERSDLITAYHKILHGNDETQKLQAAQAWSVWEGRTVSLLPATGRESSFSNAHFALAFARIENHYFHHKGFFESDNYLLQHAHKIAHIPATIVQGRFDVVTPMKSAWELHQAWPGSALTIVDAAGHAATEPGITKALIAATEKYKFRQ